MIEFAAIKVDYDTLEVQGKLSFIVNPGIPISPEITKITQITEEDVKGAKKFSAYYLELVSFFLGEKKLVAHNANFDVMVLDTELRRMGKERHFPWPFQHLCTVEQTFDIAGKRLNLSELYEELHGKPLEGKVHRAADDAFTLYECVKKLRDLGRL